MGNRDKPRPGQLDQRRLAPHPGFLRVLALRRMRFVLKPLAPKRLFDALAKEVIWALRRSDAVEPTGQISRCGVGEHGSAVSDRHRLQHLPR